jgi:kinesin family protein 14
VLANQEGAPAVKVVNTDMRVATIWSVEKYYERLEQMRDAYDAWLSDNSSVSDGVEQLFFDPRDTWVADASSSSPQVSEALPKTGLCRQQIQLTTWFSLSLPAAREP